MDLSVLVTGPFEIRFYDNINSEHNYFFHVKLYDFFCCIFVLLSSIICALKSRVSTDDSFCTFASNRKR